MGLRLLHSALLHPCLPKGVWLGLLQGVGRGLRQRPGQERWQMWLGCLEGGWGVREVYVRLVQLVD